MIHPDESERSALVKVARWVWENRFVVVRIASPAPLRLPPLAHSRSPVACPPEYSHSQPPAMNRKRGASEAFEGLAGSGQVSPLRPEELAPKMPATSPHGSPNSEAPVPVRTPGTFSRFMVEQITCPVCVTVMCGTIFQVCAPRHRRRNSTPSPSVVRLPSSPFILVGTC
jgi:hypothetical protein